MTHNNSNNTQHEQPQLQQHRQQRNLKQLRSFFGSRLEGCQTETILVHTDKAKMVKRPNPGKAVQHMQCVGSGEVKTRRKELEQDLCESMKFVSEEMLMATKKVFAGEGTYYLEKRFN